MTEAAAATFEEWIKHVFDPDPPVGLTNVAWPPVSLEYMIQLFENAESVLSTFSDAQLDAGMLHIAQQMPGKEAYLSLSDTDQRAAVHSFFTLFEQLFMTRCWPDPFDYRSGKRKQLNIVCSEWWSEIPIRPNAVNKSEQIVDLRFLEVVGRILTLESDTCKESALNGLGLWAADYPEQVHTIVDTFLAQHPGIRSELRILVRRVYQGFFLTQQDRNRMVERIEQAFKDTIYPGDENITDQDHCGECAEIAEAFQGKHWRDLHDVSFLRYHSAALSLFKHAAFRFYLPAFIRAALVDPETADIILDGIVFHLRPPVQSKTEALKRAERSIALWRSMTALAMTPNEVEEFADEQLDRASEFDPTEEKEYFLSRVSGFTQSQKDVIIAYLKYRARNEANFRLNDADHQEDWERTFDFWEHFKE